MDINTSYCLNQNVSMRGNLSIIVEKLKKDYMLETVFDNLTLSIPKNSEGVINKEALDSSDKKAFKDLINNICSRTFQGTIASLKESFKGKLTIVADETYNSTPAKVTKDLLGRIVSVNTGAKNIEEARAHMGLDQTRIMKLKSKSGEFEYVQVYGREYEEAYGITKEYYSWNPNTNSMDCRVFDWDYTGI